MPIQHSPPARQTRSQDRAQAVLTPTPRAPLDGSPAVTQEDPVWKTNLKGPGEDDEEEEENSVEEEESDGTEGFPDSVGASQGTGGPTIAQSDQSESSLLPIIQKMTQIISNIQAV
ncbi:hypothetical protein O181_092197 [Austropuccinia psidii MF-1]|uniref:Uncharacterized protein n=1 Tax=Austropuccinia psidii MF-1 TaxID=1389203 RepID=A0A9Q3IZ05_9BASI|nr:hypothetical protein [Austropuccinia psidii MF-1]